MAAAAASAVQKMRVCCKDNPPVSKTYEVKQYILVGQRPWHLELSPDQSKLYVANGLTNDMTIIDVSSLKAEKSVPVGRLPWGIAVVR